METGFYAEIEFKRAPRFNSDSAEPLIQRLRETKEGDIVKATLRLCCDEKMKKKDGLFLEVYELRKLMENEKVQELSQHFQVWVSYATERDEESLVELNKELNNIMKRGIKFKQLRIDPNEMREKEVEALIEGIKPEHRECLSPLVFWIDSSEGVAFLDHCQKLNWPIDKVSFLYFDDMDWKHIKRLIKGSKFKIFFRAPHIYTNPDFLPDFEALLSGDGEVKIDSPSKDDSQSLPWFSALVDPLLYRWRKLKKDRIKTLTVTNAVMGGFGSRIRIQGSEIEINCPIIENILSFLSRTISSMEGILLEIEKLSIDGSRDNATEAAFDRAVVKPVQQLIVLMSERKHCLLSLTVSIDHEYIDIPKTLQQQIEANLAKRMSNWIKSGAEVIYGRVKLMMIGQGRAGKSSTIRALLSEPFDPNLDSTLVAKADKDISINVQDASSNWEDTNLEKNWVNEEMREYLSKVETHIKLNGDNRGKRILVPKVEEQTKTPVNTEDHSTKSTVKPNIKNVNVAENLRKELTRNRKKRNEDKEKIRTHHYLYDASNERVFVRLTVWDFGGQHVFYALHHLYLTSRGIYILVFDMTLMLKQMEEELRVINFWIDSVELHAPQASVILVGTRCDDVTRIDKTRINNALKKVIEAKNVKVLEPGYLCYYPVENSNSLSRSSMISSLRARINGQGKALRKDAETLNLWQRKIPLIWIYFMSHLVNKFEGCITRNQLFDIGNDMNMDTEKDILPMLEFYQRVGAIITFMKASSNNVQMISDYIVLSPEWLLKVLGSFVYDPKVHNRQKALKEKENLGRLIAMYEKTGILSKSLLLFILSEAKVHEKDYGFILDLCQEMLIMSKFDFEPNWFTIPNDTFFLVPSMNQQVTTEENIQEDAAVEDCINIYLHFEKTIPIGLFERVICVMLTCNRDFDGTTMEPTITKNFAMFCFRETEVFLVDEHKNGDFRISLNNEGGSDPNIIVNLLEIGSMIQEKLKTDVLGKHLASSIEIKSLDEKGKVFRCSAEDLMVAITKNSKRMKMRGSNGRQRMKEIAQLNSFGDAAKLIVERQKQEEEENKLKWEYDVFLAHTWGPNNATHDQVVKVDKLLKEMKLKTWLDEANLKYYVSNDIVDGLKKSSCILVFITELYLKKVENADTNASKEFAQAVKKGPKYLVPVVLDPKCLDPKSWLGSKVGYQLTDALYFDFSSEEKIKANIGKLCERIAEMSQAERPQTA